MKKIKLIYILLILTMVHSCDYLDIVPDNLATIEYAFRNRTQAEKYLYTCYSYRPKIGGLEHDPALNGSDETCQRYSLQSMWPNFKSSQIARGYQTANAPILNYWDGENDSNGNPVIKSLWVGIRDCNIFLENIGSVHDLTDYELKRWTAEVKFLKAYYHYYLMKCYGPIPIMDTNLPISAGVNEVKVHREPIDEVVKYIADLMKEAAEELPQANQIIEGTEAGRVYDLVALTMRAEVLLTAASPFFNGNVDFASMVDNRGINLFPQEYDANKWKIAADACKEAIDACHQQGKALYHRVDPLVMSQNEIFQHQTTLRQAVCERWNEELIWGNSDYDNWKLAQYSTPRLIRMPDRINDCTSEWAPTLEVVEKFYTANGVPIDEDKDWNTNNWYEKRFDIRPETPTGDEIYYVKDGTRTVYLHYNREPRFYSSIGFDKGIYFGNGYYDFGNNVKFCNFVNLQVSGFQGGSGYSATGYAAKKMHSFKNAQTTSQVSAEYFPFPVLRLADLYLMYAEALNESQGPVDEVFYYLDAIRERAGLEGVKDSWTKYSNNPNKPNSQEGLREIIRQERSIELAFESKRFWDIRRWKMLNVMNELPTGWNIMGETEEEFYIPTKVSMYNGGFTIKDYLWPIKDSNLFVNENLIQNYGW